MDLSYEYPELPEVVQQPSRAAGRRDRPLPPPNPKPDLSHSQFREPTPCCECGGYVKTWNCVQCCDYFCDTCWDKQRPHKPGKYGIDGRQHEKVDEEVIHRLEQIFGQPTEDEQHERYVNDISTTWFGVIKETNQLTLHSSNRLVNILHESQVVGETTERYPSLVSFVGQTGAGKSTLIKMLIDREKAKLRDPSEDQIFPGPVPGLVGDNIPTTGDVHLYADPASYYQARPMLYADCEGLTGGEHAPRALKHREMMENVKGPKAFKDKLRKRLTWATDNPKLQSREYAVTALFPRILYTFSDVVVFVLRELRTFETKVLQQLINWAAKSFDQSLNQPSLPHIVIVVNATDNNIDEKQWDVDTATRELLDQYRDSVHQVPALQELLVRLQAIGKKIRTTQDLLEYYYSSITVIRIPSKGRYMQMDNQVGKLYNIIAAKSAYSHAYKQQIRMLLNAEKLPQYVNAAYDHFSRKLDEPFDFMEEARRHTPLPQDFSGHILNLILSMYKHPEWFNYDAKTLLTRLSRPIASCIMLAATRESRQGSYSRLLRSTYSDLLWKACEEFCSQWLHCGFEKNGMRCCATKRAHKKGHQAWNGKVMSRGHYLSPFDFASFLPDWIFKIDKYIHDLNNRLQHALDRDERKCIPRMHWEVMSSYYRQIHPRAIGRLRSHVTCLGCIQKIPENVLPCGHALCKACIQSTGDFAGQGLFELSNCPLHPEKTCWSPPARIRFKPNEAGVRVLCLDGGGVRGIIELVILREIEEKLGGFIPIQNFFDLIVGTSTGGVIALGLGVKRWSVSECTKHFKSLCGEAFTMRGPPALKAFAIVSHKSAYKTKPLEHALQSAFNDNSPLYGGITLSHSTDIRVAVTSTLASENRPVVISNYNTGGRRDSLPYQFIRPSDTFAELKIWEAARATAAAPPYFKPFIQEKTMSGYIDGAVHHNNPVLVADYERRQLWEEVSDWPPDIVLSLGTGLGSKQSPRTQSPSGFMNPSDSSIQNHGRRLRNIGGLSYMWRAANDMIDNQLDCEDIWNRHVTRPLSPGRASRIGDRDRNKRINVKFPGRRPDLDGVKDLENIERHATNMVRDDPDILEVAHKLVASCFYFEKSGLVHDREASGYKCTGKIRCRFDDGSQELKGLGQILQRCIRGTKFTPYFFLQEDYGSSGQRNYEVPIPDHTIELMRVNGHFRLTRRLQIEGAYQSSVTRVCLCLQPEDYRYGYHSGYYHDPVERFIPISGFPRELHTQESFSPPNPDDVQAGDGAIPELPALPVSQPLSSSLGPSGRWGFSGLFQTVVNKSQTSLSVKSSGTDLRSNSTDTNLGHLRGKMSKSTLSSWDTCSSTEISQSRFEGEKGEYDDELLKCLLSYDLV